MKTEDKERIERQAEGLSRLRVLPKGLRVAFKNGYTAGATAERNKAIDEYCDRLKEAIRIEPEQIEDWSVEEITQLIDILKKEFI